MTKLKAGRPPKGSWKKEITVCAKRGHHLYKAKVYRDKGTGYMCSKLVCTCCSYEAPTVKVMKK